MLRWRDGEAKLDLLPSLPDVPIDETSVWVMERKGTGVVFLTVSQGEDWWVFTLTPQGEWWFASRFSQTIGHIADLADFDRNGILDAFCVSGIIGSARISWGGRKEGWTNLGILYAYPKIADLDGDGWMEIVMVAEDGRLKIWRFDRRERRLKVVANSLLLPVT